MLVKKSIVERWYQRDSWVYKNFAYLFQNPLWTKKVPSGFSVCPYFWLNIFSLCIFRPFFVFPLKYLILPLIRLIGKPAIFVDKFVHRLFTKIFSKENPDETYSRGFGMFTMFVVLAVGLLVAILGTKLFFGLKGIYPQLAAMTFGCFVFWSAASFLTLFGVILAHKKFTKTDCKTMNYLFVWLGLFILSAIIFIHSEIASFFGTIASQSWVGLTILGGWIGAGLKYAGLGIWWLVSASPFGMPLPWWSYLMVFAGLMWLGEKLLTWIDNRHVNALLTDTTENGHARNRDSWITTFVRVLTMAEWWNEGNALFTESSDTYPWRKDEYLSKACYILRRDLYRQAFTILTKDKMATLQTVYPLLTPEMLDTMEELSQTDSRFQYLENKFGGGINFTVDDIYAAIVSAYNEPSVNKMINDLAESLMREATRKATRQAAKKTSWSHNACLAVTNAIEHNVKAIGNGIKTGAKETGAFFAYLWILIKAKKQGACPYLRFTDVVDICPRCKGAGNIGGSGHNFGFVIQQCPVCHGSRTTVPKTKNSVDKAS